MASLGWECVNRARPPARHAVVVIPMVRKGLSNQRMRVVQDIVTATLLGYAVRLPPNILLRKGCHFQSTCHRHHSSSSHHWSNASFWTAYDRALTLEALASVGVCVTDHPASEVGVAPLQWPQAASGLEEARRVVAEWIADAETSTTRSSSSSRPASFYLAKPNHCCTLLVPDSAVALRLVADVNLALVTANRSRLHAEQVLNKKAQAGGSRTCVVHWRTSDDARKSSSRPAHKDRYAEKMRAAMEAVDRACASGWFALGDGDLERDPRLVAVGGSVLSKASFRGVVDWRREYGDWDDLLAMVDFEIGRRADVFVGSPFSPFSVLIALSRFDAKPSTTVMNATVDVHDHLAHVFRLQFPHGWDAVVRDPCRVLAEIYRGNVAASSCGFRTYDRRHDPDVRAGLVGLASRRAWVETAMYNTVPPEDRLVRVYETYDEAPVFDHWREYASRYSRHFPLPCEECPPVHMLEIGVQSGGSGRVWRTYYGSRLRYVGVDINPLCKAHESPADHIHIEIGSQLDPDFLIGVCDEFGPFDIIIDDGGHMSKMIDVSLRTLWATPQCMKPNAVYAVEDLHTMVRTGFCDEPGTQAPQPPDGRHNSLCSSFSNLLVELFHSMHLYWLADGQLDLKHRDDADILPKPWGNSVSAIHLYDSLMIITRSPTKPYTRITRGTWRTPLVAPPDNQTSDATMDAMARAKTSKKKRHDKKTSRPPRRSH